MSDPNVLKLPNVEPREITDLRYVPSTGTGTVQLPLSPEMAALLKELECRIYRKRKPR